MAKELGEGLEFEKEFAGVRCIDDLVLKDPGKVVRNEDGVEACSERRIDIGLGGVAYHPGGRWVAVVAMDEVSVGLGVLLREHFDRAEEWTQAGALELVSLLDRVALGDEDESMALLEFSQRFIDTG